MSSSRTSTVLLLAGLLLRSGVFIPDAALSTTDRAWWQGETGKVELGSRRGRMSVREFANQKALVDYAERKGLVFVWAFGKHHGQLSPVAVFTKRQQLLSPDQDEIVDVRTHRRGVRRAMLFPKAILQAEFAATRRCASVWRSSESSCGR